MAIGTQTLSLDNTRKVLQEYAELMVEAYKKGLVDYGNITTRRQLYDSVTVHTADVVYGQMKISINLQHYWKYIEDGRQAYGEGYKGHLPPVEEIQNWIEVRPDIFGSAQTKRGVDSYSSLTPNLSEFGKATKTTPLAWAVATNIAKKGIDPHPILKETLDGLMAGFRKALSEALAKDLGGMLSEIVSSVWGGVDLNKAAGKWTGTNIYETITL